MKPFVVKTSVPAKKAMSDRIKGELKPLDKYEVDIRNGEKTKFFVNGFKTGEVVRLPVKFDNPEEAKEFAKATLSEGVYRAIFIYAVNEYDHGVLYATIRKNDTDFKYPQLNRW
jgi:hypothetical protein